MKNEPVSHTPENGSIVELDEYRKSVGAGKSSRKRTRVMVEVACDDPEGADQEVLRDGGRLCESLKSHGLYGVPDRDLGGFLEQLAKEFVLQHAAPVKGGKRIPT